MERGADREEFIADGDAWLADHGYSRGEAIRLEAWREAFDPSQPREPAGSSDGGQWTDGGGAGGSAESPPASAQRGRGFGAGPPLGHRTAAPIEAFEQEYATADVEYGRAVGAGGQVLLHKTSGDPGAINFSPAEMSAMRGRVEVFTHNHPKEMSLSLDDMLFAQALGIGEMRAVTRSAVYRIQLGPARWSRGELTKEFTLASAEVAADLRSRARAGKITKAQAERLFQHLVWQRIAKRYPDHLLYWAEPRVQREAEAFDPSQPREPAGSPDGGQWTDGGGGGGTGGTSDQRDAPTGRGSLPGLRPEVAEPIVEFERKYATASIEYGRAVLADGTVLVDLQGEAAAVTISPAEMARMKSRGVTFTHNHPKGSGFSRDDIFLAASLNLAEIRAHTPQRVTYRMRPGSEGWPTVEVITEEFVQADTEVYAELRSQVNRGTLSIEAANRLHHHLLWDKVAKRVPQHLLYSRVEAVDHARDTRRRLEAGRHGAGSVLRAGEADPRALRDRGGLPAGPGRLESGPGGAAGDPARPVAAPIWGWGRWRLVPLYHIPPAALTESENHGHEYRPIPWSSMPALAVGHDEGEWSRPRAARRRGGPADVLVRRRRGQREAEVFSTEGWVPVAPTDPRAGVWIPAPGGRALDGPDGGHWQLRSVRPPLDVIEAWPGLREMSLPVTPGYHGWRVAVVGPQEAEAIALGEAWDPAQHPRAPAGSPEGGEFTAGGRGVTIRPAPAKARAFSGWPVSLKKEMTKQETGAIGEAVAVAYLRSLGFRDAATVNVGRNNMPVDVVFDHEVIEVKAGLASNGPSAQQWRLTIGEPGVKEKAWLARASDAAKERWNDRKERAIVARKAAMMRSIAKSLGRRAVGGRTITTIVDPDRGLVDVYSFRGFHPRIGWNSDQAKAGYVGTFRYAGASR